MVLEHADTHVVLDLTVSVGAQLQDGDTVHVRTT